jgi:hypothetical protein
LPAHSSHVGIPKLVYEGSRPVVAKRQLLRIADASMSSSGDQHMSAYAGQRQGCPRLVLAATHIEPREAACCQRTPSSSWPYNTSQSSLWSNIAPKLRVVMTMVTLCPDQHQVARTRFTKTRRALRSARDVCHKPAFAGMTLRVPFSTAAYPPTHARPLTVCP